jgi:murein DD-endopeptidase MepM/ murein hydrolase activator NlpD
MDGQGEEDSVDVVVGQAAGERGIPPPEEFCSTAGCGDTSQAPEVLCSSVGCGAGEEEPIDICSSAGCGDTDQPPEISCSRPPCTEPDVVTTVVPPLDLPRLDLDPKWGPVIQWLPDVLAAQEQVQRELGVFVPTNVILAEMMIESQGVMPDSANYAGAVGLLQVTDQTFGAHLYDLARASREPAYSLWCGVTELALRHNDSKRFNDDNPGQPLPWANIVVGFFSGHYFPTGAADAYNDDFNYQKMFIQYFNELEAAGGVRGIQGGQDTFASVIPADWLAGVGLPINGLEAIWKGSLNMSVAMPIVNQDFGPSDFSVNVHPEWYTYSIEYGFTQPGHTGVDIGVPAETPLYAPTNAVVYCAGTGNPGFPAEEGCAAFADVTGAWTSGRLQLKLPNGDMVIYGHVRRTVVEPGASVVKGQLVGYSGNQNGDHLHLEYRVKDPTTSSGWRLVDPKLTGLNGLRPTVLPSQPTPQTTTTPETPQQPEQPQQPAQPTATPRPPTNTPQPTATLAPTPEPPQEPPPEPTDEPPPEAPA